MTAAGEDLDVAVRAATPGGRLTGTIALVTGAGRGIGRSISLALADAGATVALCARTEDQLVAVADEIADAGGIAMTVAADIAAVGAAESVIEQVIKQYGCVDTLVNAAGVSPVYTGAERIAAEDFDLVMATNLRAPFRFSQVVGTHMLERGTGSIVNVTSIGGLVALPKLAAYCAAKAALNSLTRVLAVEWATRGVRVNAVAPGFVRTAMTEELLAHETLGPSLLSSAPLGRFAESHEIASTVVFLASDDASYITGQTICVDGGWTAL